MELKTYVAQFINKYGNGWAIVNAYHPNQVEDILKNQGRFKDIIVTSFKEVKHFGNTMSIVYEGSITTLGKTPYDLAKEEGFEGTLEEWLESLKGPKGDKGEQGDKGEKGEKGDPGTIDYNELENAPTNVSFFNNDAGYLTEHQDISNKANASDVYTKTETYNKTEVNNLITTPNQEYMSVIATAQTTTITDLLPTTGEANTIYRVGNWDGTQYNNSVFSEYAWNGSTYIKLSTKSQVGDIYDISVNHAGTKYSNLVAALGINGANIPQSLQKGGMSVKFVQSSDNKYVQYFLTSTSWSTDISDWVKGGGGSGDGAFDVSEYNKIDNTPATYDTIALALAAVPVSKRKAGMDIKFIKNVSATYNVVKTEGLDTEPTTGDNVIHITGDTDPNIEDGLYNASDLSSLNNVSTLPTINNIKTYYIAVTETVEEETITTYTTWDVVKVSEDSGVYVQYRYIKNVYTNDDDVNTGNFQFTSSQNWVEIDEADKSLQYIKENYNYVVGGYLNNRGEVVAYAYGKCSNFIPVNIGDVLICNGSTPGMNPIMCGYNKTTSFIDILLTYNDKNDRIIIIRDSRIKYIRACAADSNTSRKLVKLNPNFLGNIVDAIKDNSSDINLLKDIVCSYIEDSLQTSDCVPNKYINVNGVISSANGYFYKEFEVTAGSVLTIKTSVNHGSVSALSKKINATSYQNLLSGIIGSTEKTYTIQEDCTVAVSFSAPLNEDRYFKAINKVQFQNVIEAVKNLDNTLDEKLINEGVITIVDDDFTDGLNGFAVKTDGTTITATNYNSKTFELLAGARVVFTSYTHSAIAPLAKKVGNSYTVLCTAQGFKTETFEYVATENMTLVASYYNPYNDDIHIYIRTSLVQSNDENIQSLLEYRTQLNESLMIQNIELGFLFNKIAVIGDSMSVATMDGYNPPLGASWLSFLAKRWDCQGKEFYARGGAQCYTWLNSDDWGLGKLLRDTNIYNCYFIAYGHNDDKTVGEATDAAAPVTISEDNVPSCPDGYTFCAYYKAIINQIRTKAPHAMIFCLSQYDYSVAPGGWHSEYGEAVIEIAEWCYDNGDKLVHHLDTGGVPISDMRIGGHYSTIGYAYIASKVNEEANKVIYQYRADEEIKSFGIYNL